MRIIDKQNDYYDYLQDSSDTLVFDRRGSFLLTKEIFCSRLNLRKYNYYKSPDCFALLQCGATFWLLLVSITKWNEYNPLDYQIQFITTWKNYDKDRELLKFDFTLNASVFSSNPNSCQITSIAECILSTSNSPIFLNRLIAL